MLENAIHVGLSALEYWGGGEASGMEAVVDFYRNEWVGAGERG